MSLSYHSKLMLILVFFFFNDTATTEIYTLSLHDALPIGHHVVKRSQGGSDWDLDALVADRKSTRLNSSHVRISYAVFCLKKKKGKHSTDLLEKKKNRRKRERDGIGRE